MTRRSLYPVLILAALTGCGENAPEPEPPSAPPAPPAVITTTSVPTAQKASVTPPHYSHKAAHSKNPERRRRGIPGLQRVHPVRLSHQVPGGRGDSADSPGTARGRLEAPKRSQTEPERSQTEPAERGRIDADGESTGAADPALDRSTATQTTVRSPGSTLECENRLELNSELPVTVV